MAKKSTLTPEQRSQLVLRLLSKEEPAVQIARRAAISEQTLYRWREEFTSGGKHALPLSCWPRPSTGCLMPVRTLTKPGRTCPLDFGAKTREVTV